MTHVSSSQDLNTTRNQITVELSVDNAALDVLPRIMLELQALCSPSAHSMTTRSVGLPPVESAEDLPEFNGNEAATPATPEQLHEEILARFDDLDRAMRLLVDP